MGKSYLHRLNFKTKSEVLQSFNLLDYNCLTSKFFKPNVSLFEGSNCFLRFILDPPLILYMVLPTTNGKGFFVFCILQLSISRCIACYPNTICKDFLLWIVALLPPMREKCSHLKWDYLWLLMNNYSSVCSISS